VRRSAIDKAGLFLTNLGHGEDTEFWLRLARHCPVYYHQQAVFEYCVQDSTVSGTSAKASHQTAQMLLGLMHVLELQKSYVQNSDNADYRLAYQRGKEYWINCYGPDLFHQFVRYVREGKAFEALHVLGVMFLYYPQGVGVAFEYFHRLFQRAVRGSIEAAEI
jgi:hypothetical protein